MTQPPQAHSSLKQRQTTAYLAILNGLVWILGTLSLVLGIVAMVANLDSAFMVLAGSMAPRLPLGSKAAMIPLDKSPFAPSFISLA